MSKTKKIFLIIILVIFVISAIVIAFSIYDSILARAEHTGTGFEFDGLTYTSAVDFKEIGDYTETYKVVCKTKDKCWVLYEIEEYPNREYLIARCGWNAHLVRLVTD